MRRLVFNIFLLMPLMACGSLLGGSSNVGGLGGSGGQCGGDLGVSAGAQKVEALVRAADRVKASAEAIPETLLDACKQIGRDLGMAGGELSGSGVEATRSVCNAVSSELRARLGELRDAPGVQVELRAIPPSCEVSVDAYAGCAADCDVEVDPGGVELECEGGELRGGCEAECTGSCAVEVSAGCEGTCEGFCEGECSARNEDGSCAGSCSGECRGECVAEASGSCSGECRGGCSVEFTEPTCTGELRPPNVSAECQASCEAEMNAEASCEPGEVELVITGDLTGGLEARVAQLRAALEGGFGTLLSIDQRLQRLQASVEGLLQQAAELPSAVASVGMDAVQCANAAMTQLQSVSMDLTVSVEVSASVSASAAG